MENKNLVNNLVLQQMNDSDAMGYNKSYIATPIDADFRLLDNAYKDTGRAYAKLKTAISNNKCSSEGCEYENRMLKQLEEAPSVTTDFLENLLAELSVTEEPNFDPNNDYAYTLASYMMNGRPGFSKSDGYVASLTLLNDGSQELFFNGPGFVIPLIINSIALATLLESGTSIVASTPDINKSMDELLVETGIFPPDAVDEKGMLSAGAKISEEFIIKFNGEPDYEIIDIGNGKGRNILRFDLDKIEKKVTPFINAEISGLMSSEQDTIAAWNVYISKGTSQEEDDQMVQDANAASSSWSYTEDLPLMQDKKVLFAKKYKEYFFNNYLKQFLTNKLPSVEEDAAVFDLEEGRQAKADKFIEANQQN